ncbi:MAG: DUF4105 domain-containing protein [Bdellovibrio sp.]
MSKFVIAALLLLSSCGSSAQIKLRLQEPAGLSPSQTKTLRHFIQTTEGLLPRGLDTGKSRYVDIRFEKMQGSLQDMLSPQKAASEGAVMGFLENIYFSSRPSKIVLNENLIYLVTDPSWSQARSYRHGKGARLAQATLLHEIAHFLDFNTSLSEDIQEDIRLCRQDSDSLPKFFENCSEALSVRGGISGDPAFRKHIRWSQTQKSMSPRSPNTYEYENIHEFFAVNFEYFILDPEFACRRPSLAQYFRKTLRIDPFPGKSCDMSHTVFLDNLGERVELNPAQVISIDYLHASPGAAIMSRWGHAMLRLNICKDLSNRESCPVEEQSSIVLTFNAVVVDTLISQWRGLVGKYPSQLLYRSLSDVVEEYTTSEFRDVSIYPLKLNRSQVEDLTVKVIELYWDYSGKYYFLSNNCAIEVQALLNSILPFNQALQFAPLTTPMGLLSFLQSSGLVDREPTKIYQSREEVYHKALQILDVRMGSVKNPSLEQYISLSAAHRGELFKSKSPLSAKDKAAYLLLERYILNLRIQDLYEKISVLVYKENLATGAAVLKDKSQLLHQGVESYGIPSGRDLMSSDKIQELQREVRVYKDNLFEKLAERFPRERAEIEATKENFSFTGKTK